MVLWKPVRPLALAAFRATLRSYLLLSGRQYRYVFILGHMRSGSTLLAHILASHPDFAGAGESHIVYNSANDLPFLVWRTGEYLHRPVIRRTYIVDQINHEYVSRDVLLSNRLYRSIILIREPSATIRSMINLLKCNQETALDAYVNRLDDLMEYGLLLKERAVMIEYDELVSSAEATLRGLTNFFALKKPLNASYKTHRMTARVEGHGDPSENIKAGRIIRTAAHHDIELSDAILTKAAAAFHNCQEALSGVVPRVREYRDDATRRTIDPRAQ